MTSVFHTFYTSSETESKLADIYRNDLQQKQKKLDETWRKTGVIQKYNAIASINQPQREFYVMEGSDARDGSDASDARDTSDTSDDSNARDTSDDSNTRDGRDGNDARDDSNDNDDSDGNDGNDGNDARDDSNDNDDSDGNDGNDGNDASDGCDGCDASDASNGCDGCDLSGRSVYYKLHDTFIKAPKEAEEGGGVYKLEPRLLQHVELFQSRHTTFRVVFSPSIYYRGENGVCRATLYSIPDGDDAPEILNIEDEENYEL